MIMDFLVSKSCPLGLEIHIPLENIEDEKEAILKASEIARGTKEGCTVGLFTRDGHAIRGWKVLAGGKVRNEDASVIAENCFVGPDSFDSAKRQAERLPKARAKKK
jgi:hypothetical protein